MQHGNAFQASSPKTSPAIAPAFFWPAKPPRRWRTEFPFGDPLRNRIVSRSSSRMLYVDLTLTVRQFTTIIICRWLLLIGARLRHRGRTLRQSCRATHIALIASRFLSAQAYRGALKDFVLYAMRERSMGKPTSSQIMNILWRRLPKISVRHRIVFKFSPFPRHFLGLVIAKS